MSDIYQKLLDTPEGRSALFEEHAILSVTEHICELLNDESNGMNRRRLAEAAELTPGRISQLLDGEANMTLSTIAKLLGAFGRVVEFNSRRIEDRGTKCFFLHNSPDWQPIQQDFGSAAVARQPMVTRNTRTGS